MQLKSFEGSREGEGVNYDLAEKRKVLHSIANDITILSTYLDRVEKRLQEVETDEFSKELSLLKDGGVRIDQLIDNIKLIQQYFRKQERNEA